MYRRSLLLLACIVSGAASGETLSVEATAHYVPLNDPAWIELGDGRAAYRYYQRHLTAIGADGQIESHWCSGTNIVSGADSEDEREFEFGGGFCTIIDKDGDAYWTWFEVDGRGQFTWKVMGGTGKFRGSSGGGVSTATTGGPDGTAVFEIVGEIEIRDEAH